jgi:putative inorganic carbon (HCO3(-)) transporter
MGLGLFLKSFGPLSLYGGGLLCALLAMGGKVRYAMWLMIFLIPLRNVVEKIQGLPAGNQFIDILLAGAIIGWLGSVGTKGKPLFQKSSINGIAAIVVIYTFMSALWGGVYLHGELAFDPHDPRIQSWKNFCLLPIFFFVTINSATEKKDVWMMVAVMCFAMLLVDYYTIHQIHWYSNLESRAKITGTFQFLGPNEVAAFFNEYTVILLGVFYSLKKSKYKWPLFGLILLNLFCITFTYSRGAYAGLIMGLMILFAVKDKKLLIGLVLVLCLWQAVLPEKVIARIKETKDQSGQLDESSQRRINIWHDALRLFEANPIAGIGFGVFRYLGLDLGDTHNIYVKLLAEQGVIGFCLFFVMVFCFLREGWKLYQKGQSEEERGLGLGFIACLFVMLVNNFFGDRWSYMEPNAYLWIFAGLVSRLNAMAKEPKVAIDVEVVQKPSVEPLYVRIKKRMEATPIPQKVVKKKIRYYDM